MRTVAPPVLYMEVLRRKKRKTQQEIAERSGLDQKRISEIEKGQVPTEEELELLSYALDFSPPEVLLRPVEIPTGDNGNAVRRERVLELFRELGIEVV